MKATSQTIQVITRKGIPKNSVAAIARELRSVGSVCIREESVGLQASAWWLPALVIVFVGKPLCEGFLNELGANGARRLRAKLTKFIQRLKKRENRWVRSSDMQDHKAQSKTGQRTPLPGRLGPTFSINFELEHTTRLRYSAHCVFPHELSDEDIAMALKHLSSGHQGRSQPRTSQIPSAWLSLSRRHIHL
jgi:hypothetical protein